MAELFKNMWNEPFFDGFTKALKCVLDDFDGQLFLSQITDDEWENKTFPVQGREGPPSIFLTDEEVRAAIQDVSFPVS